VRENRYLRARGQTELLAAVLDSPELRADIAVRLGLTRGALLRRLNDTAPPQPSIAYRAFGEDFSVVAMHGVCDDYHGDRYGKFGDPVTLRFYADPSCGVPQWVFEMADWNFMDAGRPAYVAYLYGTVLDSILFTSGIQSDLAARYAYILQDRGPTEIRIKDEVYAVGRRTSKTDPTIVPRLRRVFQRRWLMVVLAGTVQFMRKSGLRWFALQQFELEPEEDADGHQMRRIYRNLPRRFNGRYTRVLTEDCEYRYCVCDVRRLAEIADTPE
jgi:hypothetical protein